MRALLVAALCLGGCHKDDYQVITPGLPTDAAVSCGLVTCASLQATCGPIGDGCGNVFSCGTCTAPEVCGGAGSLFTCGAPPCAPRTCTDAGANCGRVADGGGGLPPRRGPRPPGARRGGGGGGGPRGRPPRPG